MISNQRVCLRLRRQYRRSGQETKQHKTLAEDRQKWRFDDEDPGPESPAEGESMSAFAGLVSWNKCDGSNSPCPIVMQNHRSYHLSREKFDRGLLSTRDRLQRFCAQRIAPLRSAGALRTMWQTLPINCVPTSKNSQLAYATFEPRFPSWSNGSSTTRLNM